MNLAISQGQAIRSMTGRSLVTRFMTFAPRDMELRGVVSLE
jgi:hypothetical protein